MRLGERPVAHARKVRNMKSRLRRAIRTGAIVVASTSAALPLVASSVSASPSVNAPQRGGVLRMVGAGDVDYFDTAEAYYDTTWGLFRTFTRQL